MATVNQWVLSRDEVQSFVRRNGLSKVGVNRSTGQAIYRDAQGYSYTVASRGGAMVISKVSTRCGSC